MKKILFAAIILAAGILTSCKNDKAPVDPYEGKTNPSTICAENLIAHFPFDGNAKELINNIEPKTVGTGVAYETGRRGQAFKGAAKNELVYDAAAIKGVHEMKDFSFAFWLKHQAVPQSQAPVPWLFGFTKKDDFWGQLAVTLDRGGEDNTDSLRIKTAVNGNRWADSNLHPSLIANRWMHIVGVVKNVDDTLQTMDMFVNGAPVETLHWDFANVADPIDFSKTEILLFGQWGPRVLNNAQDEWMGDMDGLLDEVRLYNAALTPAQAKALYDAEITVIND